MKELWGKDTALEKLLTPRALKAGDVYRVSAFAFPFEADGRRYLFHTMTRQALDPEGFRFYKDRYTAEEIENSEALRFLQKNRFLVPAEDDEAAYYKNTVQLLRLKSQKKKYSVYTVLPTTACNARCVYCYEEDMKKVTMDGKTVDDLIRFILKTHDEKEEIRLAWFGGEPLLCADIIDRVCAALKAENVNYCSSMISNGSLIDGNIIDKMTGLWKLKHIQLSMDCAEQEYIRRKNNYHYHDEYHTVMRAADRMAQKGISVFIRCNVDGDNIKDIDAFLSDLNETVTEKTKISIQFQPLYDTQRMVTSAPVWAACEKAMYRVRELGFGSTAGAKLHRLKLVHCMSESPYESVVVAPDGLLYLCEHCIPGTDCGNLKDGIVNKAYVASFALPEEPRRECRDCVFLPECTSFTRCAVKRAVCKEVEKMWLTAMLAEEVRKQRQKQCAESDAARC